MAFVNHYFVCWSTHITSLYNLDSKTCCRAVCFNMHFYFWQAFNFLITTFQLFRRVAAALPGMDSTPEKSKEDSILAFSAVTFPFLTEFYNYHLLGWAYRLFVTLWGWALLGFCRDVSGTATVVWCLPVGINWGSCLSLYKHTQLFIMANTSFAFST